MSIPYRWQGEVGPQRLAAVIHEPWLRKEPVCTRRQWNTAQSPPYLAPHGLAFPDELGPVALPGPGQIHLALGFSTRVGGGHEGLPQGLRCSWFLRDYTALHMRTQYAHVHMLEQIQAS